MYSIVFLLKLINESSDFQIRLILHSLAHKAQPTFPADVLQYLFLFSMFRDPQMAHVAFQTKVSILFLKYDLSEKLFLLLCLGQAYSFLKKKFIYFCCARSSLLHTGVL